jgi:hypothetical protein
MDNPSFEQAFRRTFYQGLWGKDKAINMSLVSFIEKGH